MPGTPIPAPALTTGFIGLGAMGAPMAMNLLKAGLPVIVFDVDAAKCATLAAAGASVGAHPAAVAAAATRIICMVGMTAQVEAVVNGPDGILRSARPGQHIACMSTIAPATIVALHETCAAHGVSFIDAPVSGGIDRAVAGTLAIFTGGSEAARAVWQDAFAAMGSDVFPMGRVGQGMSVKLINNMLVQINTAAIAEAMALGARAGLDAQAMYDAIKVSTGYSVAFEMRVPRMIRRDFAPGGVMELSYKDGELAIAHAKDLGAPLLLAPLAQQIYQIGRNMGLADEDAAATIKIYEKLGGVA